MNILLNFLPLKAGGGVQVGLDFIRNLEGDGRQHRWGLICSKKTPFEQCDLPNNCLRIAAVGRSLDERLHFETFTARHIAHQFGADISFTQFGPHFTTLRVPHVVGCAYSNLFYPEIDFWKDLSFLQRMYRRFVDRMRLNRLKKANYVVFETSDLAERAVKQGHLQRDCCTFVLPTVSKEFQRFSSNKQITDVLSVIPPGFRICLVSRYAKNKNIENIVRAISLLKNECNVSDVYLILTISNENGSMETLRKMASALNVDENVFSVGEVPYESCGLVYRASNASILPSNLESFSNNIGEAWATMTPLIISDTDWARSLCGDAAEYVTQSSPREIAIGIKNLMSDSSRRTQLIEKGTRMLANYPSSAERFNSYVDIIERVYESSKKS